jgi:hypothetical protein
VSLLFYLFLLQGWQWTCVRVQISVFLSNFPASKHTRKSSQHVGSYPVVWVVIFNPPEPSGLTFKSFKSCTHTHTHTHARTRARGAYVCMYGLRYKQRIFPYAELVFMTETGYVYCTARTKSWSILEANLRRFKGRAVALAVSFGLLATEALGSTPSVHMRLWWAEWHWDGSYFGFPLLASFQQCPLVVFICMLLVSEGETGKAWEPS